MTDTCELMEELTTHPRRLKRLEDFHQAEAEPLNTLLQGQRRLLNEIYSKQKAHDTRFEAIGNRIGLMDKQLNATESNTNEIKNDIFKIQSDIIFMKDNQKEIQNDIGNLQSDVSILKTDAYALNHDVAELKSDMSSVKDKLDLVLAKLSRQE